MSNKTDKAGKAKTKKHMKVSKKNKIITIVVVVLLVLVCFCYFAHQTGLPAKILPGAKVMQTVDGKEKTVKKISIVEMNYYYYTTLENYTKTGLIKSQEDLDTVYNTNNGQTYREMIWESAANTAQQQVLVEKAANNDDSFKSEAAKDYAEVQVRSMRDSVEQYNAIYGTNMTMDQYLQRRYGKGMTAQIYRKLMRRAAVVEEYTQFVKQFKSVPTAEQIDAKHNEDPNADKSVKMQLFFVAAESNKDSTEEEKKAAMKVAEEKAHKIADNCTNYLDFQIRVRSVCDEAYLKRMNDGEDPTSIDGQTKANLEAYNKEFAELCFNPETKPNTSMVFPDSEGVGYFAALFEEAYLDEEQVASFRVIELSDELLKDITKSPADKAPSFEKLEAELKGYQSQVTSEEDFIRFAKEHTIDTPSLLKGGYYAGVTADNEDMFPRTAVNDESDPVLAKEDQELIDWLYSADRKKGDMIVIRCASSVKLYYFCDNVPAWKNRIRNTMTNENYDAWYKASASDESYSTVINHGLIDFFS